MNLRLTFGTLRVRASFFYVMLVLLLQDGGTDCFNLYERRILPTVCAFLLGFIINGDFVFNSLSV